MTSRTARHALLRIVCLALPLAAPALVTYALMARYGYALENYRPGIPNDETINFLEIQAFATHGFGGGHFGVEEQVAPASFSRFGVHGPGFAVIYGCLARLFGVSYALATYLNLGAMTLALAAYVTLTRPANVGLVLLALFVATFWPFYFFVFSWMQDAFQYALAVVFAGLFAALLGDPPPALRRVLFGATLVAVCAASLIRVSWVALLLPLILLNRRDATARGTFFAAGCACALTVACMKAFQTLCAPFPAEPGAFLMNKLFTGGIAWSAYAKHLRTNLHVLASYFTEAVPLGRDILAQSFLLLAAVAGIAAWRWAVSRRAKRLPPTDRASAPAAQDFGADATGPGTARAAGAGAGPWLAFLAYNQGAMALAMFFLYYVANFGAPRICSVHLLLGVLVAFRAPLRSLRLFLPAAAVFNALVTAPTLGFLQRYDSPRFNIPATVNAPARVEAFRQAMAYLMPFEPGADGWANTLLTDRLPPELNGLPPGIGVEYYFRPEVLSRPVRSRYIIAAPEDISPLHGRVKELAQLPPLAEQLYNYKGKGQPRLYLNLAPAAAQPRRPNPRGDRP